MDWSKAKNILIFALVAANIFIGIKYYESVTAAERNELEAQQYIGNYLSGLGVNASFSVPDHEKKLPVLFVSIAKGEGEETAPGGMRIVVTGAGGLRAGNPVQGDNKGSIISPFDGLLKLSCQLDAEDLEGLEITGAELVYLVDRSGIDESGGQDTAVPAWEFETSRGTYYIEALAR